MLDYRISTYAGKYHSVLQMMRSLLTLNRVFWAFLTPAKLIIHCLKLLDATLLPIQARWLSEDYAIAFHLPMPAGEGIHVGHVGSSV